MAFMGDAGAAARSERVEKPGRQLASRINGHVVALLTNSRGQKLSRKEAPVASEADGHQWAGGSRGPTK